MSKGLQAALVGVVAAMVGCQAGGAPLSNADKAAIKRLSDSVAVLFNAKDFEGAVRLIYVEDAVSLPPNSPALGGQAAIFSFLKSYPAFTDFSVQQQMIDGEGQLAYVHGTYSMTVAMPGAAAPMKDEGKYLEIWRKQTDGSWKVIRDMFNSDLPNPAPPPSAPSPAPSTR